MGAQPCGNTPYRYQPVEQVTSSCCFLKSTSNQSFRILFKTDQTDQSAALAKKYSCFSSKYIIFSQEPFMKLIFPSALIKNLSPKM